MFTGIVEDVGLVSKVVKKEDYSKFFIVSSLIMNDVKIGDSISVNGVCLTVSDIINDTLVFDAICETLKVTNLNFVDNGSNVNLERAMMLSSRIDGHIVQGHIESVGEVVKIEDLNEQIELSIKINKNQIKYCLPKGSIAVNGISLTIAEIKNDIIKLAIIPHTLKNTTLSYINNGDIVNIETDMFAKYVEKIINYNNV